MRARVLLGTGVVVLVLGAVWWLQRPGALVPEAPAPLAGWLSQTGLFEGGRPDAVDPACLPFSPQYPLWSDGTVKRRWVRLPEATSIDASDVDAWRFPVGTRFWKEFALGPRKIETRLIERTSEHEWRFATYRWLPDGSDAELVGPRGLVGAAVSPGGTRYDLPSVADCKACHEAGRVPVLGFTALQLSGDRDPLAPHATVRGSHDLDVQALLTRGLLRHLPARWATEAPRILAPTPEGRASLGYLHANCAHCHRQGSLIPDVDLDVEQRIGEGPDRVLASLIATAHKRLPGEATGRPRIVFGDPEAGMLLMRLATRDPLLQMPPLATRWRDDEALALLQRWVQTTHPVALATRP